MKKIITLLSLTLLASFSYSQIFFNGGIYSNANWTLANSPYIITGNVVVFPGVTLNIEPGVEIRIKEGPNFTYYAIESRGTINMIGEPDALITVRADSAVTTVGSWSGFIVKNSQGGVINYDYVSISNAIAAVSYDGSLPESIALHNSFYTYNYQCINVGINLLLEDCVFEHNTMAVYGWSIFNIKNCIFDSNEVALNIYVSDCIIDSCVFIDNNSAINFSSYAYNGFTITNSLFENNIIGCNYPGNGTISNCEFQNNGEALINTVDVDITDCLFENNSTALGLSFGSTLTNCEVYNNEIGVEIGPFTFGQPAPIIENNKICFNTSYNIENITDLNLYIPTNCFCETDSAIIESKILDGYDDITKGLISYAIYDSTCTNQTRIVNKLGGTLSTENISDLNINVFPNPTSEFINIINTKKFNTLEIYNLDGKLLFNSNMKEGQNTFNISFLSNGIYFARLTDNNLNTKTIKVSIIK
jgi:hypothetical protein